MRPIPRRLPHVLIALTLLAAGSAALAMRLHRSAPRAPAAAVPTPAAVDLATLELPCWSCREAREWPLASRVDLDLLAPLGDGPGNAGEWLLQFTAGHGRRGGELAAIEARRVPGPADLGPVLPPDDPVLLEAEPWMDQARFELYPDLLPIEGWRTTIPPLTLPLLLARSWVARGRAADDPELALEDFRRAVRLGRLLRSEDVTLVADFAGLACIRAGAAAIYDHARGQADAELALAASAVLGEIAPQRLLAGARIAEILLTGPGDEGSGPVDAGRLATVVEEARSAPERRMRDEAVLQLGFVAHRGDAAQRGEARALLDELARDPDPIVAAMARSALAVPPA